MSEFYTVRFAHMERLPPWRKGQKITRGAIIGIMGSTGQSTADHLHCDCVKGVQEEPYHLADIGTRLVASKEQLDYFIDSELFGVEEVITTGFLDADYRRQFRKDHPGYDVVPIDRVRWVNGVKTGTKDHYAIHWNRSKDGIVQRVGYDEKGYGNFIQISFQA